MGPNTYLVPALVALAAGGVVLYVAGTRRRRRPPIDEMQPVNTYCDIRSANPCGEPSECVALYEEGQAPPGYENIGICFVPTGGQ